MARRNAPSRAELLALRNQGMTRDQMAAHYKVSLSVVKDWIRDANLPPPPPPKSRRIKKLDYSRGDSSSLDYVPSPFEQAKKILGDRLEERRGAGYFLDGKPIKAEVIFEAAGLSRDR